MSENVFFWFSILKSIPNEQLLTRLCIYFFFFLNQARRIRHQITIRKMQLLSRRSNTYVSSLTETLQITWTEISLSLNWSWNTFVSNSRFQNHVQALFSNNLSRGDDIATITRSIIRRYLRLIEWNDTIVSPRSVIKGKITLLESLS